MVPVTATLAQAAETSTTKPTVTVTDKVFAMQYSVSSQKESLSPGAIAGITVACAVGIAILFGAILLIRRYVKRARDMAALRRSVRDSLNSPVPPPGTSEIPIATPTVAHDMNASWSAGDASVDTHTTTDSYYKPASRPYRPRRNIHESIALQEPSAFSLAKEQRFRPIAELNGPDLLIYRNKTLEDKNPWWKQRPCGDPRWYEPVTVPNEHVAPNVQLAPVGSSIDEPFPRIQRTILKPQTTIIHDNVPVSRPTPGPKKQRGWPLPEPDSEEETVVPRKGREENTEKAEVGMDKKGKRKVTVEANPRAKGHAIIQPDNFI
ncbi:uncharacterized protein CTHT_0034020 [Thermochaetoides thermophila DSM 1495]|uniref:Uncharacterized protein n=1 Tax=Chaetomium thermophilum (strain DSM 1495 / CBS 144.50 / IMI 039719) TaxID=759272 RepID=G0S634_CHATD|nr:hypothetical protein CTHT_0034020 [Thermochaetoides thermophila DSM 1495]EGS21542.1 hypothetical protein CTHT_0034020 [Thermochaetoides thermophila DSM 1495]